MSSVPEVGFVFPGQGSQHAGMAESLKGLWPAYGAHLSAVEDVRESVHGPQAVALGELIDNGPSEVLSLTENAQPALLLVEYGWDRVLRGMGITPAFVAGHSLGEYSAMLSAGVFGFETAGRLVMERGKLMSEAASEVEGGMAAVLGLDPDMLDWDKLLDLAGGLLQVEVANINCPGQIVISGVRPDVERAGRILTELGAKKVVPLSVSGAFHSTLMKSAAERFAEALSSVPFARAKVPVVQNSTSEPAQEPGDIMAGLVPQMTGPVLWQDSVVEMVNRGVDLFVEVGPGTVLKGLIKRTVPETPVYAVDDDRDREAVGELVAQAT